MKSTNISRKKTLMHILIITFIISMLLVIRVFYIVFIQGDFLKEKAYAQQTLNRSINPKRGTIYDSSGEIALALSASVETITINPNNIQKNDKEKVAKAFADIFSLDYEKVLKKVNKNSSIETIIKKVDKEQADKLRIWMNENNINKGINIDEDTKRYYPYSFLAANVIGFTGSDNQGLDGIESIYDDVLKGKPGKILKPTDATGSGMEDIGEEYVKATDGDNLIFCDISI